MKLTLFKCTENIRYTGTYKLRTQLKLGRHFLCSLVAFLISGRMGWIVASFIVDIVVVKVHIYISGLRKPLQSWS